MQGSKYTDNQRLKAKILMAKGNSLAYCSDKLNIPLSTLYDWYDAFKDDEEFKKLREKNEIDIENQLMRIQTKAFALIEQAMEETDDVTLKDISQLNIVGGTAFDKLRLIKGESTANVGVQGLEQMLKKVADADEF